MPVKSIYLLLFQEKTWPGFTLYTAALHSARSVSGLKYSRGTQRTTNYTITPDNRVPPTEDREDTFYFQIISI